MSEKDDSKKRKNRTLAHVILFTKTKNFKAKNPFAPSQFQSKSSLKKSLLREYNKDSICTPPFMLDYLHSICIFELQNSPVTLCKRCTWLPQLMFLLLLREWDLMEGATIELAKERKTLRFPDFFKSAELFLFLCYVFVLFFAPTFSFLSFIFIVNQKQGLVTVLRCY